jgi:hypothetical protein
MSEEDQAVDEFTTADRSAAKYMLIKVPDFATDPSGDPNPDPKRVGGDDRASERAGRYGLGMTSYLRLGVPAENDIGDDLLAHAYAVGAVGFTGTSKIADPNDPTKKIEVTVPFVDDERNRGNESALTEPHVAAGHGLTKDERYLFHSKHMLTKGGWRDHSDGNRISTTYGDKLEVIRGNYKLVVMGRQDDPGNSQGHEWCGNHVQDWGQATMPGASVTLEWIQSGNLPPAGGVDLGDGERYVGGSWLLINSTERVYQYSRNAGNFRTQQWGVKLESYTGSENPADVATKPEDGYKGHPTKAEDMAYHVHENTSELADKLQPSSVGLPRGNPHIIEKTWARRIDSYTGTSNWHIPKVYEETWVDDLESKETLGTVNETSKVTTKTSTETIDNLTETSTVTAKHESNSTVATLIETSRIGAQVSTTFAATIVDTTFVGATNSATIAGAAGDVTIAGAIGEVTLALGKLELSVIPLTIALTVGWGKEFKIGDVDEVALFKKKMNITELKQVIEDTQLILNHNKASVTEKTAAMIMQHKALQVYLGA